MTETQVILAIVLTGFAILNITNIGLILLAGRQ